MGQFSWIAQDTERSILISSPKAPFFTAFMHDNKGNVWNEPEYEGYGEFGGKDFFELLAEMNSDLYPLPEGKELRKHGIDITYCRHTLERRTPETKRITTTRNDGLTLITTGTDEPEEGYRTPNVTEHSDWKWINEAPDRCPDQGWYTSSDNDDDDDWFRY